MHYFGDEEIQENPAEKDDEMLAAISASDFAPEIKGALMALVKTKFKGEGKGGKYGKGGSVATGPKGGQSMEVDGQGDPGAKSEQRECYECGKKGHLGRDCHIRQARVAAGGPAILKGDPKGGKAGKGGGKGGKAGKGGNGQWPSQQQWKGMYPGPTMQTWNSWHPQTGQASSAKALFEPPQQLSSLAELFQGPAALSCFSCVPKKKAAWAKCVHNHNVSFESQNKFNVLTDDDDQQKMKINIMDAIKPPSKNQQKKMAKQGRKSRDEPQAVTPLNTSTSSPCQEMDDEMKRWVQRVKEAEKELGEDEKAEADKRRAQSEWCSRQHGIEEGARCPEGVNVNVIDDKLLAFVCGKSTEGPRGEKLSNNFSGEKLSNNFPGDKLSKNFPGPNGRPSLMMFNEVRKAGLCPVTDTSQDNSDSSLQIGNGPIDTSKWEVLMAVVDSGATVPVLHPKTGKAYSVEQSAASRAGVEYEMANGKTTPNLGQKRMAVLTEEGTLRGYSSQCADVSKALQSVRSAVASKHAVCFGLGPEGNDHLIINRESGEINRMIDDGTNYLQKLLVIPPDQINAVQAKLQELRQWQHPPEVEAGFARPGR